MKTRTIILSAILASSLISCKKNASDTIDSTLEFQLKAANTSSAVNRTLSTITWNSGFANLTEIKFEAKQAGKENEFKSNVRTHADLFAAVSTIGMINVPAGTFDEVEFKLQAAATANEPALFLQGTINGVPVSFKVDNALEIKSEQSQVTLSGADIALNKIDLSALSAGLSSTDFANASQTNGTIIISNSSNSNLFTVMFSNLQREHETEVEVHHRH